MITAVLTINNKGTEMNTTIVAIIFQEGGKLITELIRTRRHKREAPIQEPMLEYPAEPNYEAIAQTTPKENKATSVESGCVPCSIGHLGTCSGLLNEAVRFARKDGIASSEVIDRVNICTDELNALERVDLRPEMITNLPAWEKKLAEQALNESRAIRHKLESLSTFEELEKVAASTQSTRQHIGREWFQQRLSKMPKEEKTELIEKTLEKLEKEE